MEKEKQTQKKAFFYWIVFIIVVILVFIAGLLAASVIEHRKESQTRITFSQEIAELEPDNEKWGKNFPFEYEAYLQTKDTSFKSKHGGSSMIHYLEEFPNLIILWAGYPFSKDYNQGRGHYWTIIDTRNTLRTGGADNSPMPATCWTCKSSDIPKIMNEMGDTNFYKQSWISMGSKVTHPIGCSDCHDAKTMELRISRPALIQAFERQGKKITDFSHQEMRSLVCAQCHVEYYFSGTGKFLVFPWDKGFSADSMESYYDAIAFSDWTHSLSKAKMLKAQHPDYELYMTGVHSSRGVACADCHMPFKVVGSRKYTDHHIQSPLNNISNSCQVCHRQSEEQLRNDVYNRQDRVLEIRNIAQNSLAKAHLEAKIALEKGIPEEQLIEVQKLLRSAQWRWDWVAAANSLGFHSPVEALRVLGTAIERSEKARGLLREIFVKNNIEMPSTLPDISTKEKTWNVIGLDIKSLILDKQKLLNNIIPEWTKK